MSMTAYYDREADVIHGADKGSLTWQHERGHQLLAPWVTPFIGWFAPLVMLGHKIDELQAALDGEHRRADAAVSALDKAEKQVKKSDDEIERLEKREYELEKRVKELEARQKK